MMQMLAAGGLPVLTDGRRAADQDNPRGYLEFEAVSRLRTDATWFTQATGKALKVVAPLLEFLPPGEYRIVLMRRNLEEVIRSQRAMLQRLGKAGGRLSDQQLQAALAKQLLRAEGVLTDRGFPWLEIEHRRCIDDPSAVAAAVNQFLGGELDEAAMASAVAPQLHRHRVDR
jgi:hypothetical protein